LIRATPAMVAHEEQFYSGAGGGEGSQSAADERMRRILAMPPDELIAFRRS